MRTKLIIHLVAFNLIYLSASTLLSAQPSFTQSQLKADFKLFCQALKEAHSGLYRYNTQNHIDSLFAQTEKKIGPNMSQQEFYKLLLPVAVQIKCGHTKFHPDSNWSTNFYFNDEKVFPWRLYFQEDRAFVLGTYVDKIEAPEGSEIISINGKPISEIIKTLLTDFFSDGNNTTFKYIEMSHYFSAYYANLIEGPDSFLVKYKNGGTFAEIKIPAISHSTIERFEERINTQNSSKPPYQLEMKSNETAVLTISSFWMEPDGLKFKKFLKNSFNTIRDKHIKNLIIDVRDNEGGMDRRGALLLSYLMDQNFDYYDRLEMTQRRKYSFANQAHKPSFYGILRHLISKEKDGTFVWKHNKNLRKQRPQTNHFSGNVYVLINGASFSVTAEFAAVAHYLKRATFIGEETGGGYYGNNSGTFVIVTLPNSKLNVGIPMMAYYTKVKGYSHPDRGVIPDYEVKTRISDILQGKDPVLEFSLKLIENDQN